MTTTETTDRSRPAGGFLMRGTVIRWVTDRGFGFVRPDGALGHDRSARVFLHISHCPDVRLHDVVTFQIGHDRDGRSQAVNVTVLSRGDGA